MTAYDSVVIGAGQAGLAISRCLSEHGVSHVVIERGKIGNSWRTQRWDGFFLNTPNVTNVLPGDHYDGEAPFGFAPTRTLVNYFEDYARRHGLPIEEGKSVRSVKQAGDGFDVDVDGTVHTGRTVVLCSGDQNTPRIPGCASDLPGDLHRLHAANYRRPDALPDGAVLIVGSGQTGVQIAEELLEAKRTVHLCTSKVGRAPRRYRGRDLMAWMKLIGLGEQRREDLDNPAEAWAAQPQISGTHGGHSVSLHQLARDGAHLLGRLAGVSGRTLAIGDDLQANAEFGDQGSAKLRAGIDAFIDKSGTDAPAAEPDPVDVPFDGLAERAAIRELDIDAAGIRTVIFATGFGPNFDYVPREWLDERGWPRHEGGVCDVGGVYCLGLLWLRRRLSGIIPGIAGDAEHLAGLIAERIAGGSN